MKNTFLYFLILLLVLGTGCDKKEDNNDDNGNSGGTVLTIEDLLIKDNEITGWPYSGVGWTANNITELTEQINGGAEIYQKHGFKEAAHQSYSGTIDNGTRTLELTVYNQDSDANAKATYEDPDLGMTGATPWDDGAAGTAAQYVRFGGLSQKLVFYKGAYYVLIEINYDTEESLNIIKQFALNVDGKIN